MTIKKRFVAVSLVLMYLALPGLGVSVTLAAEEDATEQARLAELDAYWAEVSRAVREGDFEGYRATCHEQGVLVSGSSQICQPLSEALARWKKDFTQTRSGEVKASVEFRFSQRLGDATTAHETGMFCYTSVDADGNRKVSYIHLEALLVKQGTWKIMMEHQKSKGTQHEWDALK
jgi:hypothetical protein